MTKLKKEHINMSTEFVKHGGGSKGHKLKTFIVALSAFFLVGCVGGVVPTFKDSQGRTVKNMPKEAFLAAQMTDNVNSCIELAQKKYDDDQKTIESRKTKITGVNMNADQFLAHRLAEALEKTFLATIEANRDIELAKLGVPFSTDGIPSCEKLGYSHMVLEKKRINHATFNNIGGKVLKTALNVFGIVEGRKVLLHVADKLAEPRITSGAGSTNILGNDNVYEPDNRVNSCIEDGTCVTPPEEDVESEEIIDEGPEETEEVLISE